MANDPMKHADMRVLLAASTMEPKKLEALLPKGAGQRLADAIQSEMLPVWAGLALQANGLHELDRQTQAVTTLALGYMLRDQSLTEAAAAQRAAQIVVKGDSHWMGSYFVPKRYNPDQIAAGTKTVMQQLPETIVKPADLAEMRPSDSRAAMLDALRSGGQWVTNDAGTGLVLTWPNAAREAVMVEQGGMKKPLELTWEQLKDAGTPSVDYFGRKLK